MPYSDNSLKVYQSRYNSLYSKVLSIEIQLSLYSQVCNNPDNHCILKYYCIRETELNEVKCIFKTKLIFN